MNCSNCSLLSRSLPQIYIPPHPPLPKITIINNNTTNNNNKQARKVQLKNFKVKSYKVKKLAFNPYKYLPN